MTTWVVVITKKAGKNLKKLPKEIIEILDQFRRDLEAEGPTPNGWIVKHVQGSPGCFSARLKREYRVIYEVVAPTIIVISVSHRRESY